MNVEVLNLVDQALRYSLWVFLSAFLIFLLFIRHQLRSRRKQIIDFYRSESDDLENTKRVNLIPSTNQWQMAAKALVVSCLLALAVFATVILVPIPGLQNSLAGMDLEVAPLRVTALQFERFHEGFSLEGEVWNQGEESLESLQVIIAVIGSDQELLDQISVPVAPSPLPEGTPGTFDLRYTENSPFIRGYQLAFSDSSGHLIDHETGFDVR